MASTTRASQAFASSTCAARESISARRSTIPLPAASSWTPGLAERDVAAAEKGRHPLALGLLLGEELLQPPAPAAGEAGAGRRPASRPGLIPREPIVVGLPELGTHQRQHLPLDRPVPRPEDLQAPVVRVAEEKLIRLTGQTPVVETRNLSCPCTVCRSA